MYKQIFILLLVVLAKSQIETELDAERALRQMEGSSFGQNLLTSIQIQLEAGDPADDLIHLLMAIEDGIQNDQDVDDEAAIKLGNQCVTEIERIESAIEITQTRLGEIEAELMEKVPMRTTKRNQLEDKQDFKAMIEEKIEELDAQQAKKAEEWRLEREEHDAAQLAVETAKNIIVSAMTESNFLQTKKHNQASAFVQVSEHFSKASTALQYKKFKSWNHIFKLLSQITQSVNADSETVQTVIDLCDLILDQIAESRALEKKDYDGWMSEYNNNRAGQVKTLDDTNSKILQLENAIAILTKRINGLTNEQTDLEEKLENKQTQLKQKEDFCDDEQKAYQKRREARSDDEAVVSQAIGLLTSQIRTLKKYINARRA